MTGDDLHSSHRLVEFLTAVGRYADRGSAARAAAELISEEFDAEVGAVILDGTLAAAVGFGVDEVPSQTLSGIGPGVRTVVFESLGTCHTIAAAWKGGTSGRLIIARLGREFTFDERNLLLGMSRALGLAVDMIGVLERERERHRVLEILLEIQRSISHRASLSTILAAVTDGASEVLGGRPVSLRLDDALDPDRPITAGADLTGARWTVSAPVHVNGVPAGALVAASDRGDAGGQAEGELLRTFAEHASLALTDARTVEAMQEAFRDSLTGLPNRALFLDRLTEALRQRTPAGSRLAVLFLDLDRFKAVNDSLGHAAGDELLRAAAERIRRCIRAGDTAARFGGDEFAVVLAEEDRQPRAGAVAQRIVAALRAPFTVGGRTVFIGVTIGIAYSTALTGGASSNATHPAADELLGDADLAMYEAKSEGGGRICAYDPAMRAALTLRLELEADLEGALGRRELEVFYQPIVEMEHGTTRGIEALLRWNHPARGLIAANAFIPIAEATGSITDIGRWVLDETCTRLAEWRHGAPELTANVNVSAHQLRNHSFVADVRAALGRTRLPGAALTLEITETVLIEDPESTAAQLIALKALGVSIALDDFGTGYSSLRYLQRFPVDLIKIDRSFVSGPDSDSRGYQLVRLIIELARSFGLDSVAEGIETVEQLGQLRDMGCRFGQGYYFSRPMNAAALSVHLGRPPGGEPAAVGERLQVTPALSS